MKNRNSLAYVLLAVFIAAGVLLAVRFIGGDDKKAAKPLTLEQRSGAALTRDFNAAEASNGVKITKIAKCARTGKVNEFACAAVVSNGQKEVCGGFLFTYAGARTSPENVQQIDPKYCAGA